jgi:hypothetical protein
VESYKSKKRRSIFPIKKKINNRIKKSKENIMARQIKRVNELMTLKATGRQGVLMNNGFREVKSNFLIYAALCILAVLFINMHGAYAAFQAEAFASGVGKSIGKAVVAVMWLGLGVISAGALILTPGDFKVKGAAGIGIGVLGGAGLSQIQDRFLSADLLASAFDTMPVLQGVVSYIS